MVLTPIKDACPICNSIDGRCRRGDHGLIICRQICDASGETSNLQYIKQDKAGNGMFVPRKSQSEILGYPLPSLSPQERNHYYRALLNQLKLHPDDGADLEQRGLNPRQIDAGMFRSVKRWQRVNGLPLSLPGVLPGGKLNIPGEGFLCPIWDSDDLIVGLQLRLRNPDDGNRYRWLTSKTRNHPEAPTAHLEGQLPLTVAKPLGDVSSPNIGIAEGILKPWIAAQKLSQVILGATGGNFKSTVKHFKVALKFASCKLGSRVIAFYPDAGSISNQQVRKQYEDTWKLLREWGYQIQVTWWGQFEKSSPDIDELDDLGSISWLTPEEWLTLRAPDSTKDRRTVQQIASKAFQNQNIVPIRDRAINTNELLARIHELQHQNLAPVELAAAKMQLRRSAEVAEREFEKLWQSVEDALDQAEDATISVDLLLSAQQSSLSLDAVLPYPLSSPLDQYAQWQNIRSEVCLMAVLAVTGSLAKNGTKAVLHRSIDFEVTPNLFVGIVAEPSQKKSPILKTLARKPLWVLANESKAQYEYDRQEWERQKKEAQNNKEDFNLPEPVLRVYFYARATGEAILRQASRVPDQGLLCLSDELEGYFKSLNQYRRGLGSDAEDVLTYYDGHGGGAVLRVDGVQSDVQDLNLGFLGSVQPKVLRNRMGTCEDGNGNWARWLFILQPTAPSTLPDESGGFDLTELLAGLYRKITHLPARQYGLTGEAFKFFQAAYNQLEIQRVEDPNPALRAAYGKTAGRIGKLALNLHLIEAVVASEQPADLISLATIERAIAIAKLAIDQIRALYSEFDGNELASNLVKVVELSRRKGKIKARDVQQSFTQSVRPDSATVRQWFTQLHEDGYGYLSGEGRGLSFTAYPERQAQSESEPKKQVEDKAEVNSIEMGECEQQVLIDKFLRKYSLAWQQNGHSTSELAKVTKDLEPLPKEIKNQIWEALPIGIRERIQVEVLDKPLNIKEVS